MKNYILLLFLTYLNSYSLANECSHVDDYLPNQHRVDCHPEQLTDVKEQQQTCVSRGCCWREPVGNHFPGYRISSPWCYFPDKYDNYKVVSVTHFAFQDKTEEIKILLNRTSSPSFNLSEDIRRLEVTVSSLSEDVVRVKITDAESKRFQVPDPKLKLPLFRSKFTDKKYEVSISAATGRLKITRKANKKTIFSVNLKKIIFSDQFIKLTNEEVPSTSLYGLGQNMDSFRKDFSSHFKRIVMFNRGDAVRKENNLYGSHPFYLMRDDDDNSHGILLFNNNYQEVILSPSPYISYHTTGGVLDFFVFLGPSNNNVMEQKTKLLGLTPLPSVWSLGFHLCRFGYKNTSHLEDIYRKNIEAGIPIDIQWFDIDYMDRRNDFTVDKKNFGNLNDFSQKVRSSGRKTVAILDPAVSASEPRGSYPPYDDGIKDDVFVKNEDGSYFIGKVWNPDTSIFPDFTADKTRKYWVNQVQKFYREQLVFDGIWIDMNEPALMTDGNKVGGCNKSSSLNYPKYFPGQDIENLNPTKGTMCPSAKHSLGNHYDLHSMYAFYESMATFQSLQKVFPNKRPFVLSRATVSGQNVYSSLWTGDVFSDWDSLRHSIFDLQSMNLFGFPMVGADICGHIGDTNVELCARWHSLGAFYSFSRNHNSESSRPQDPVSLGQVVVDAAKYALNIRYTLMPYLYTVFYENSVTGRPVIRSVSWDHPYDQEAERNANAETQFLWGTSLMIIPVVMEGRKDVTAYFPSKTTWYDYQTLRQVINASATNREVRFDVPLEKITVAIRGGSIIAFHTRVERTLSEQQNASEYGLIIALDDEGRAKGTLYWDDGDTADNHETGKYSLIQFEVQDRKFKLNAKRKGYDMTNLAVVKVLGINHPVTQVRLDDRPMPFYYDKETKVLVVTNLNQSLQKDLMLIWT